jgi:hypothetical protein
MEMNKLHFLVLSPENDFFKFKGWGPFKFSKKYPAAKHYIDIYRLSYFWPILVFAGQSL